MARGRASRAQNLFHLAALGELIDELVHIAGLSGEGRFDLLNPVAANDALDQRRIGMQRGAVEKLSEGQTLLQRLLQVVFRKPGQPSQHLMQLVAGAALLLHLGDIMRVKIGEDEAGNARIMLRGRAHGVKVTGGEKVSIDRARRRRAKG